MAVSLPTSADVRKIRSRANDVLNVQLEVIRTPLLAWLGASDLAVHKVNDVVTKARARAVERREIVRRRAEQLQVQLNELPAELRERFDTDREKLRTEELRKRVDEVAERALQTYTGLADRGETTFERIRSEPRVAKAIGAVGEATGRLDKRVERVVDDVHDAGEEVLGRVSTETRSVGERAARATQRLATDVARRVSRAGRETAEAVEETGEDAAHLTRSTTRKAANEAAPRKPSTTRRAPNGSANGK